ncbi:MAG TPA: NUDIX hydrolase [Gammaproteobacteria bacterium]|nr:NUDIX hydrolase [Gammaproteobacteria bacterium]
MQPNNTQWLKWASELQAIAQNGLTYSKNIFDLHRFKAILKLSAEMMAGHTNASHEHIINVFTAESGYATPKLDGRGVVFKDNKILMVKERADDLWSLPGGWIDINESASSAVVREIREESGYETRAVKLLALLDKQKQDHPPEWPHAYKCFFLCELIGGSPQTSDETSAVDFFAKDELPELSINRVTKAQILRFFEHYTHLDWPTDFD